jgi:cytochrome-b5 reductase
MARLAARALTTTTFQPFPAGVDGLTPAWLDFTLAASWTVARDTKVLRFELPAPLTTLRALNAPAGVKVRAEVEGEVLDKSYSPISRPNVDAHVDLLVKSYTPQPGGGLGHYLCNLAVADSISIRLKAERNWGALGTPLRANRFEEIVLIGNGTGVAPLYQIANAVLNDPQERTRLRFISAHKSEKDYILGEQIEEWAAASPERFEARVAYSDAGGRRIDADTLSSWLPPPAAPSPRDGGGPAEPPLAIVVCGTDGFLSDVAGPHVRVAVPGESKKRKLPGPIEGHLAALGYSERSCVVLKL